MRIIRRTSSSSSIRGSRSREIRKRKSLEMESIQLEKKRTDNDDTVVVEQKKKKKEIN